MDQEDLLERAHTIARTHSALLTDALGPGRVRALWLTGSSILGDLTPGSDIDTVTITDGPLSPEEEGAISQVHSALAQQFPGARYDTTYLDAAGLARPPEPGLVVPQSIDGHLILDQPGGEVHAVTWFTLPHAIRADGDDPADIEIAASRAAAVAHSRDNLQSYWMDSVVHGIRTALAGRDADGPLDHPGTVAWVVLGAPRLAMFADPTTPYAGPIPSKTEAGRWVVAHRPAFADLARRALAARHGESVRFTVAEARAAAALVETLAG